MIMFTQSFFSPVWCVPRGSSRGKKKLAPGGVDFHHVDFRQLVDRAGPSRTFFSPDLFFLSET